MRYRTLTQAQYFELRSALAVATESFRELPYDDDPNATDGFPTVGYGIRTDIAINVKAILAALNIVETPQSTPIEIAAINNLYNSIFGLTVSGAVDDSTSALEQDWNDAFRAYDVAIGVPPQPSYPLTQAEALLIKSYVAREKEDQVNTDVAQELGADLGGGTVEHYNVSLTNPLGTGAVMDAGEIPYSFARAAFVDMTFNGVSIGASTSLRGGAIYESSSALAHTDNAIAINDAFARAIAYYEAGYNSNGGQSRTFGLGVRRVVEATAIGLYDEDASTLDAATVAQFFGSLSGYRGNQFNVATDINDEVSNVTGAAGRNFHAALYANATIAAVNAELNDSTLHLRGVWSEAAEINTNYNLGETISATGNDWNGTKLALFARWKAVLTAHDALLSEGFAAPVLTDQTEIKLGHYHDDSNITGDPTQSNYMFGGFGVNNIEGGEGSDVAFGFSGTDELSGRGGADLLFGGEGDDTISGGAGSDLIHGGVLAAPGQAPIVAIGVADGVDTASYAASGGSQGIVVTTSTNIAGALTVTDDFGDTDTLISIERVIGTPNNDIIDLSQASESSVYSGQTGTTIEFTSGPLQGIAFEGFNGIIASDGAEDVIDYSASSTSVALFSFGDGGLPLAASVAGGGQFIQDTTNPGSPMLLAGFERIIGSSERDQIDVGGAVMFVDGGGGDDILRVSTALATVDGGADDDTIYSGTGTTIYGGSGRDTIHISGHSALFADASATDSIAYAGRLINGGLGWGDATETKHMTNLAQGVRYSRNQDNELFIEGIGGQKLFVADWQGGPGAKAQIAGIYLGLKELSAYQLLDPSNPGGDNFVGALVETLRSINFRFFGEPIVNNDPLVLDLDGDGIELSARSSSSPLFDIDNDGFSEKTGWVFGGDGFLAIDENSDGVINSITELFGDDQTSGFDELATHDLNADGVIDSADSVFGSLRVWRDENGDAVTDAGELLTLAELGIVSITLPTTLTTPIFNAGNVIEAVSSFSLASGETRDIADVAFEVDQVNSTFLGDATISASAAALPELKGYGDVPSLQIAATLRPELVQLIQDTATNANSISLNSLAETMRPLLNTWAAYDYSGQNAPAPADQLPYALRYQYAVDDAGSVTVSRYLYAVQTDVDGVMVRSYRSSDGTSIPSAFEAGASEAEAVAWLEARAAESGTFVGSFSSVELNTLEKLTGTDIPVEEVFGDPDVSSLNYYGLQSANNDERGAIREYIEAHANLEVRTATTFAVQSGLSSFFPDVTYDANEDVFVGTVDGDLTSAYEAILNGAPTDAAGAYDYLDGWAPVLRVFLAQFDRGDDHLVNSYSYQFANMVRGYEELSSFPIDIMTAAIALDIPGVVQVNGTDGADIFYVSNGNEVLNGGKGVDSYVFGANFTDVVIDDREAVGDTGAAPDNLRFANLSSTDVVASRDGNNLILTFAATGQSVTVNDQFLLERYSATGTRLDDDRGVVEIVFADGVVWDELDIAKAVSNPLASDDTIVGTRHTDWLDGGAGSDLLSGGNSMDVYIYDVGHGNDTIHEYGPGIQADNGLFILLEGSDFVRFGDGITESDLTFSRDGNSNDLVITIDVTGETLTIVDQFDAHNTGPFGVRWYDRVEMFSFDSDGSLLSWEDVLQKVLVSTDGNDVLYGFYYQDVLDGGAGDDYLSGGDDGDTYYFGRGYGSDTIEEAQTNVLTSAIDRVVFREGVGVSDVTFARDGSTDDLLITIAGTDDVLRIVDQYNVTETGPYGAQAFDAVEQFEWADGTIRNWSDLRQEVIDAASTSGDDVIYGSHFADVIDAGLGNDRLEGGNGSDTYRFASGDGNDVVFDDGSNILAGNSDRIVFEDLNISDFVLTRLGSDLNDIQFSHVATGSSLTIEGQFDYPTIGVRFYEIESFEFADATIWSAADLRAEMLAQATTAGADTITGFWTDDVIIGGAGDDILQGGDGSDTYLINAGDGADIIRESVGFVTYDDDDVIEFGAGLLATDILFSQVGTDLIINFVGRNEQITVEGQFLPDAYFTWSDIETLRFADNSEITAADIRISLIADQVTPGDDDIQGFFTADLISGGAGNDTLRGSTGGDTYLFNLGDGNDTIIESVDHHLFLDGSDTVRFGTGIARADVTFSIDGDDLLATLTNGQSIRVQDHAISGNSKVERFEFSDGTVLTALEAETNAIGGQATTGDDMITGTSSANILEGGAGNDSLSGQDGSDTYIFSRGDGIDEIEEDGYLDTDVLQIQGYDPSEVSVARGGSTGTDLILTFAGTLDQITIRNTLNGSIYDEVEQIKFADGTIWTGAAVRAQLIAQSTSDLDDVIEGFGLDDTLEGGLGNDTLHGDHGADTYIFNKGDGIDEIEENGYLTGTDTLSIRGYAPGEVELSRSGTNGADLVIDFIGSTDQVTIKNTLNNDIYDQVEQVEFEDGTIWTTAIIRNLILAEESTTGDDMIEGFNASDVFGGGPGNDVLNGLDGSDTYIFNPGDGNDTIEDNGYFDTDTVEIHGYGPADVSLDRGGVDGLDLIITFAGSADSISIINTLNGSLSDQIERIMFDDGTIWSSADLRSMLIAQQATAGDDLIEGFSTGDTLEGGTGNDVLHGLDGSDVYVFNFGDGIDEIEDNGYFDADVLEISGYQTSEVVFARGSSSPDDLVVTFTNSTDQITIRNTLDNDFYDHVETIRFDDGTEWDMATVISKIPVAPSAYPNAIEGTSGNNTLNGTSGDDTLFGKEGDDTLRGAAGADTYIYRSGDGSDFLDDENNSSTAQDVLHLVDLNFADVMLSKVGNDLMVTDIATGHTIEVDEQFYTASSFYGVETIRFADGSEMDRADIQANAPQRGTSGVDTVNGTSIGDVIFGMEGDDTLRGGAGGDTYWYRSGDGSDFLDDENNSSTAQDVLKFLDLNPSDVVLSKSGNDLMVTITATGDVIEVDEQFYTTSSYYGVEKLLFADGSEMNRAEIVAATTPASQRVASPMNGKSGPIMEVVTGDPDSSITSPSLLLVDSLDLDYVSLPGGMGSYAVLRDHDDRLTITSTQPNVLAPDASPDVVEKAAPIPIMETQDADPDQSARDVNYAEVVAKSTIVPVMEVQPINTEAFAKPEVSPVSEVLDPHQETPVAESVSSLKSPVMEVQSVGADISPFLQQSGWAQDVALQYASAASDLSVDSFDFTSLAQLHQDTRPSFLQYTELSNVDDEAYQGGPMPLDVNDYAPDEGYLTLNHLQVFETDADGSWL